MGRRNFVQVVSLTTFNARTMTEIRSSFGQITTSEPTIIYLDATFFDWSGDPFIIPEYMEVTFESIGSWRVFLDGSTWTTAFQVERGGTLVLRRLYLFGFGNGVIHNQGGSLTVDNTAFQDNTGKIGGAIFSNVGTLIVTDSTFTGNTADIGGAMYIRNGPTALQDCTFSGNTAKYDGPDFHYLGPESDFAWDEKASNNGVGVEYCELNDHGVFCPDGGITRDAPTVNKHMLFSVNMTSTAA